VYKHRIKRAKSRIVKVQNVMEESTKDIGNLDIKEAILSIEQGMFDLSMDKVIDALTFIALSAVVNALLIGNPLG
jgi:hypothetical protein